MKENYSYPLNPEWTTEEIIKVMQLWEVLEKVYENKVTAEEFNDAYRSFKEVVRSIGEERQLGNEYEELTGYSLYRVAKQSRNQKTGPINKKELI